VGVVLFVDCDECVVVLVEVFLVLIDEMCVYWVFVLVECEWDVVFWESVVEVVCVLENIYLFVYVCLCLVEVCVVVGDCFGVVVVVGEVIVFFGELCVVLFVEEA